jgi:heme/copper-type cytochrome/quinol oxidase subunit 2
VSALPALWIAGGESDPVSTAMSRLLVPLLLLLLALVGLFLLLRPDSPAPDTSASANVPQGQTFDLTIDDEAMSPGEISVNEGDQVNFRITTDDPLEFHLHGYDIEDEVKPDEPAELSFEATTTGRFEVENHDTDSVLGALLVQPR